MHNRSRFISFNISLYFTASIPETEGSWYQQAGGVLPRDSAIARVGVPYGKCPCTSTPVPFNVCELHNLYWALKLIENCQGNPFRKASHLASILLDNSWGTPFQELRGKCCFKNNPVCPYKKVAAWPMAYCTTQGEQHFEGMHFCHANNPVFPNSLDAFRVSWIWKSRRPTTVAPFRSRSLWYASAIGTPSNIFLVLLHIDNGVIMLRLQPVGWIIWSLLIVSANYVVICSLLFWLMKLLLKHYATLYSYTSS